MYQREVYVNLIVEGIHKIHKVNLTNGLFKSKFLVHFRNNRLLRWPRFLFWNSFPLSCRAQILTKRSLMAFLLFKTSQSSSSHPHTTSSGWNCAESILFSLPIFISHKTAHSKHNLGNRLCVWNAPSPLSSWKTFTNSILQKIEFILEPSQNCHCLWRWRSTCSSCGRWRINGFTMAMRLSPCHRSLRAKTTSTPFYPKRPIDLLLNGSQ